MSWLKKTAVISCAVGVLASFAAMVPTSHSTEAAIAVFDAKNIEEAIKIAIQTAKIFTEEQKQLALQILNMKKLDVSMLEELMKRNEEKEKAPLSGDMLMPPGLLNDDSKSVGALWDERIGNIEDVINGNMTVYDMVVQEQKRQKAIHEASKSTAQAAQQTIQLDRQNMEDAKKALEASNKEIICCMTFCKACLPETERVLTWRHQWRLITTRKYRSKPRVKESLLTRLTFLKNG